jgi:putative DNA primase/helicase
VRHFIEAHGEARFEPHEGSPDRSINNRAGWRKGRGEEREWWIPPETWKEICKGFSPKETARALADRGMLKPDAQGKFSRSERTPYGSQRVYVVTAAILEADA